jgi:hypothetical protein
MQVVTQGANGVPDDTADSCVDGAADDGLCLQFAGATRGDIVIKWTWAVTMSDAQLPPFSGIGENMDVVRRNPIRDYLMGINWR